MRNINREISNDENVMFLCVLAKIAPLCVKHPLSEPMLFNAGVVPFSCRLDRDWRSECFTSRPFHPGFLLVRFFERHEQGKIVQPILVFLAKLGEGGILHPASGYKTFISQRQHLIMPRDNGFVVHPSFAKTGYIFQSFRWKPVS